MVQFFFKKKWNLALSYKYLHRPLAYLNLPAYSVSLSYHKMDLYPMRDRGSSKAVA
jgi:hypothetical protein